MGVERRLFHRRAAARTVHGKSFYVTEFATMRHLFLVSAILLVAVTAQAQSTPAHQPRRGARWRCGVSEGVRVVPREARRRIRARRPARCSRTIAPEAILTCADERQMFRQGSALTDAERRAVAAFLAGRPVGHGGALVDVGRCQAQPAGAVRRGAHARMERMGRRRGEHAVSDRRARRPDRADASAPEVEMGVRLRRRELRARAARRPRRPRRSSAARAATSSRSTRRPAARTGVPRAGGHPHRGLGRSVQRRATAPAGSRCTSPMARANAYAVDAETGSEIWTRKRGRSRLREVHRLARPLQRPRVRAGRRRRRRGAGRHVAATSAARSAAASPRSTPTRGAVIWKSYTIAEEPKPRGKSTDGVQTWGPAGGGIWSAPTIDPRGAARSTSRPATATPSPPQRRPTP